MQPGPRLYPERYSACIPLSSPNVRGGNWGPRRVPRDSYAEASDPARRFLASARTSPYRSPLVDT